ncbi:hypothetical protein BLGI_1819 [Brevibacillus laterosporus GI-9]|nr:hypothetical protein BLGI_1819 [Brevibacillus laterosporus GI-9]
MNEAPYKPNVVIVCLDYNKQFIFLSTFHSHPFRSVFLRLSYLQF